MLRPEIQRALSFVADNLARPITVAEVAKAAHLSEFHVHRVFHAAVGVSRPLHHTPPPRERSWFPVFIERRLVASVAHLLTAP